MREWTFPKEPVMWLALLAAIINVVVGILQGDQVLVDGIESIVGLLLAFFARSQVTPIAEPKLDKETPLVPGI